VNTNPVPYVGFVKHEPVSSVANIYYIISGELNSYY